MLRRVLSCILLLSCSTAFARINVEVDGADEALSNNIRNHIGDITEQEQQQPRLLQRKLDKTVRDATQALGYYDAHFQHTLRDDTLRIRINPGTPTVWSAPQITISGDAATLPEVRKLIDAAPFSAERVIDHSVYETFKRELLAACQENGFLDAHYAESQLLIDVPQHTATAVLSINAGERYRFSALQFVGSQIDPNLLERLSPIEPGSYYSKAQLTQLQRNLQQSNYFREINLHNDKSDNRNFAITANLTDAPRHQFSVGAGYGTDTGPRAKFRWERPFVNSQGHKLTTELSVSEPLQTLTFEYHIPLDKPLEKTLNLISEWEKKQVQDTDSTVGSVGFFFSERYAHKWRANYGATIFHERYQQGSEPSKSVAYLAPNFNITDIVVPEGIDPLSGHKIWLDILGSTPELGADISFLRTDIGYKHVFNTFGTQLLIARAEVGAISSGDIELIPASQRFFTGGDQTVRGYDFESLASTDASGDLVGGRYLNVGSVEYSFKVAEQWRAALFTDAGRAFNNEGEIWHKSVGIGVRWLSPVGQVRVDLGVPVNDEVSGFRVHIFIGPPL